MMESDSGTIRTVVWKELCPWLSIFRVFRLSIAFAAILFGAAAILLTAIGWAVLATVFSTTTPGTEWLAPYGNCPWRAVTSVVPDQPALPSAMPMIHWSEAHQGPREPVFSSWATLNAPLVNGLSTAGLSVRATACLVLCGLWGAAIWAFFGAAITRMAAVQLAAGERIGMAAAVRHAAAKWPSYFAAPLLPVGGVVLAAIPVLILGFLIRANWILFLASFIWPLVLAAGLLMALLLLGVLFGWPLMWATISTEGTDSFDALSRSYAYTFQRPLHYLFYVIVAAILGGLGWLLVQNFAAGVVWMSYWAAGLGAGGERIDSIMSGELTGFSGFAAWLIHFWAGCVKLLAVGYLFSYFWTASSCIYLLLRRDVDATEMDEVFLDADASEQDAGLTAVAPPAPEYVPPQETATATDAPPASSVSPVGAPEIAQPTNTIPLDEGPADVPPQSELPSSLPEGEKPIPPSEPEEPRS
jgi:hypothetical protein